MTLGSFAGLAVRVFPELSRFPARFARLSPLINYGGWITLTNLIVPVFFYLDRFLIGSLLSLGAVAYYTAPFELSQSF